MCILGNFKKIERQSLRKYTSTNVHRDSGLGQFIFHGTTTEPSVLIHLETAQNHLFEGFNHVKWWFNNILIWFHRGVPGVS